MSSETFSKDSYLRSAVVLGLNVIVSVLASIGVIVLGNMMSTGPDVSNRLFLTYTIGSLFASVIAFYFTRFYRIIIRFTTLQDMGRLYVAVLIKELILGVVLALFAWGLIGFGLAVAVLLIDFMITVSGMQLAFVLMMVIYGVLCRYHYGNTQVKHVLVYGVGEKSASLYTRLRNSPHYRVVGFLAYGHKHRESLLMGLPVYHFENEDDVERLDRQLKLSGVIFAYPADAKAEQDRLVEFCRLAEVKLFIAPGIDEMHEDKLLTSGIRKIKIEDLLGREEIKISMDLIKENFQGKTVMVTGAAGSIGSELCRQLAELGVGKLIMFDNAETPLHNVRLEFEDRYHHLDFVPVIGDVRSVGRLDYVFKMWRPQVVFHAAAYKHVPLMEENPCEAVMVNVGGSKNVADKCLEYGAEKMVMVSTDKAVNPTNIMGCTKRLAEIYVQSLGLAIESGRIKGKTIFVTTRFGNVLGSSGSVIPRFAAQIERGGPVTVTDPEIRRFFMTIPEACRLVMEAATMAHATRIFVFDMGTPIKIDDLARRMIHLAGYEVGTDIEILYTGLRPGEKLYEEVLATKENTIPTNHDRIFVAKVRAYDLDEITDAIVRLKEFAAVVEIPQMVKLMKKTVPEFISKHSKFEIYDRQ